jgi:hypothetical protein
MPGHHGASPEYKSPEGPNSSKMQIHQDSKSDNPVRMSNQKDSYNHGNKSWKSSQLTKECKSIEAMNNSETQIG